MGSHGILFLVTDVPGVLESYSTRSLFHPIKRDAAKLYSDFCAVDVLGGLEYNFVFSLQFLARVIVSCSPCLCVAKARRDGVANCGV